MRDNCICWPEGIARMLAIAAQVSAKRRRRLPLPACVGCFLMSGCHDFSILTWSPVALTRSLMISSAVSRSSSFSGNRVAMVAEP